MPLERQPASLWGMKSAGTSLAHYRIKSFSSHGIKSCNAEPVWKEICNTSEQLLLWERANTKVIQRLELGDRVLTLHARGDRADEGSLTRRGSKRPSPKYGREDYGAETVKCERRPRLLLPAGCVFKPITAAAAAAAAEHGTRAPFFSSCWVIIS